MAKIIVSNKKCVLEENRSTLLQKLDRELSYEVQGARYTRAFQGYRDRSGKFVKWDGRQRLLNNDLSFPRGLLQRVEKFYANLEEPLEIEDRSTVSVGNSIDLTSVLQEINKTPFDYQLQAVEVAKKNKCGIFRMCTGAGKTLTMGLITAALGKKTIIYVIGKDLLYQIYQLFQSLFPGRVGIVGDGLCQLAEITIASVWTVGQAVGLKKGILIEGDEEETLDPQKYQDIRRCLLEAKVHILDECHVSACKTIQEIYAHIEPEHMYGMSASPWRDDGADLLIECVLGQNIIDVSASKLISEGYLVKPIIRFIKVPKYTGSNKNFYQTVYSDYVINNEIRNEMVVRSTLKLVALGYLPLVLYNTINHGKILYELLKDQIPCALLSGTDDNVTREKVKEQLKQGQIKCIIASKIWDIGLDLPILSGLVLAGAGKSSVRALQRIGRVIRMSPNKPQAAVVDFLDQAPFLQKQAKSRYKIYQSEPAFELHWPQK